ncbi:BatD family protein, partial [bacterium]|nr:BatD family protein [bacterium]
MRRPLAAALIAIAWLVASHAAAQEVGVKASRGPHYVGEAIEIQLTASGFDEDPTPEPQVPPPLLGRLELVGVSPSTSSQITIINGRITQIRDVSFVYEYRFVSMEPGEVVLGPFRVAQGSVERVTRPLRFEIRPVPAREDLRVALALPERPIYVGERVPVRLEFWLESGLQKNLQSYTLHAPLFDLTDAFQFLDREESAGNTEVVVATATGSLELRGEAREEREAGVRFLVVSVERTLVPLHAGLYAIPAASLVVDEGTRWRRDLFGGRRATHVRKWRAVDAEREFEVRPVPAEGRPASFAGAVGSGFALDVAADRTVVRVGDPITLTLTLRGEGLETAALPPLDAEGLLPSSFRVPTGELAGVPDGDAKRFIAMVRVLDDQVSEIPALEYSWFDPATSSFQQTRSRPIALSVHPAEVIGAADVLAEPSEEAVPSQPHRSEAAEPIGEPVSGTRSSILTG